MNPNQDSDDEENQQVGATAARGPRNIYEISGGKLKNPVLGGTQVKTKNIYQTIQPETFSVNKDGTFKLNHGIIVYEKEPINEESRIYRGEVISELLGNYDIVLKFDKLSERSRREAKIIMQIPHHQNIVKHLFADTFNYRGQQSIYIALEKCDINMHDYVMFQLQSGIPYDAEKYMSYGYQITTGVAFLHDHNIVDRDLKPSNILLAENATLVKICDFGMSKEITPGQALAAPSIIRPGTDGWCAPEILNQEPHPPFASDTFSLALNLFFLWKLGKHAFGDKPVSWNHYIVHGQNLDLSGMMIPNSNIAMVLLKSMLDSDPTKRPKVIEVLKHKVFEAQGSQVNKVSDSHLRAIASEVVTRMQEEPSRRQRNVSPSDVTQLGVTVEQLSVAFTRAYDEKNLEIRRKGTVSSSSGIPQTQQKKGSQSSKTTRPKDLVPSTSGIRTGAQRAMFESNTSNNRDSSTFPLCKNEFKIILVGSLDDSKSKLKESCWKLVSRIYKVDERKRNEYENIGQVIEWTGNIDCSPSQQDIEKLQQQLLSMQQCNDGITCIIFAYRSGAMIVNSALNNLDSFIRKQGSRDNLRDRIRNNLAVFIFNGRPRITQDKAKIAENIYFTNNATPDTGKIESQNHFSGWMSKTVSFHSSSDHIKITDYLEDDRIIKYILKTLQRDGESVGQCKQHRN